MAQELDLLAMLRSADRSTRREVIRRAAGVGIAAPALLGILHANGVADVAAAPGGVQTRGLSRAQDGEPVQGGTMVVTGHQEVASLSPDDDSPTVHWVMVTQIHNALLEMDENYVFQPILAADMPTVSDDGLTFTFTLREGVLFHDGEAFTSEDVKYTYEWYMNPENAAINANLFSSVESVDAPDDYTVVVNLNRPNAAFYAQVGTTFIVPAHYHGEIGEDAYKAAPIGTGAFKLKEWRAAEFTEVEAFEEHFRGRPHLDIFRQDIVPEPSVRAIGLETGDSDSAVWPLTPEDNLRLAEDDNFVTFVTSSLAVNHFPLNNEHPVLSDKSVRKAMMHAIDREAVIDEIFSGTAVLATANLSPAMAQFFNPDVTQYPYDVEAAAALLDEAGWVLGDGDIREKDGQACAFTCTTISGDQTRRPEAELVQQYLREVGIDMQLEEAPVATILEQLRAGNMDASLFNWTYGGDDADPDASVALRSDGTNNFSHFNNARVDELLDLGIQELDPDARAEIYKEIQAIVADEVPFLFMMFWNWYNIFSTRVQGLPEAALAGDQLYRKANEYWVAQ
ncbi:MAG: ABC transporter substrate-binding protein [Thermomicrobiales bacterium]|nr:ABC transporter substrate-binding protein [Thermomicrobiales bacterium]